MGDVNWDEALEEADNTCRSLLAEVLGQVEDIDRLVVLVRDVDGGRQRSWTLGSEEEVIAMLELAKFKFLREAADR